MAASVETKQLHVLHRGCVSSVLLGDCPDFLPAGMTADGPKVIKVYHKECPLQPRHWLNISREVAILEQLRELRVSGVVQLYGTVDDHLNKYLVFEACTGGDLFRRLVDCGLLSEEQLCREVIIPLLKVLQSLHELSIIHRDIKPENIFFDAAGALCLGDFGLAINKLNDRPTSRVGTLDYMAPEVLAQPSADVVAVRRLQPNHLPSYGTAVDIWALGVLVYECLMGITPFGGSGPDDTAINAQFRRPAPLRPGVSAVCADFVSRVLIKQPAQRPSAQQLLGHPWVQSHMSTEDLLLYSNTAAEWLSGACRHALIERLTSCPDVTADMVLQAPPSTPEPDLKTTCHSSNVDPGRFVNLSHHLQQSLNSQVQHHQLGQTLQLQQALKQQHPRHWMQQQSTTAVARWQQVLDLHRQQQPRRQLVPVGNNSISAGPTAIPLLCRAQSAACADLLGYEGIIARQNSASAIPAAVTKAARTLHPAKGPSEIQGGSILASTAAVEQTRSQRQKQRVLGPTETIEAPACYGTMSTSAVPASPVTTKPSAGSSCWLLSPQPPNSSGKQHAEMARNVRHQQNLLAGLIPPRPAASVLLPTLATSAMHFAQDVHNGGAHSSSTKVSMLKANSVEGPHVHWIAPNTSHAGSAQTAVADQQQQPTHLNKCHPSGSEATHSVCARGSQKGHSVSARRALELPGMVETSVSVMRQALQRPDAAVVVESAGSPNTPVWATWHSPNSTADPLDAATINWCSPRPATPTGSSCKGSDISRVLAEATATIKHSLAAPAPPSAGTLKITSPRLPASGAGTDRPDTPEAPVPKQQAAQQKGGAWLKKTLGMLLGSGKKSVTCSLEQVSGRKWVSSLNAHTIKNQ